MTKTLIRTILTTIAAVALVVASAAPAGAATIDGAFINGTATKRCTPDIAIIVTVWLDHLTVERLQAKTQFYNGWTLLQSTPNAEIPRKNSLGMLGWMNATTARVIVSAVDGYGPSETIDVPLPAC